MIPSPNRMRRRDAVLHAPLIATALAVAVPVCATAIGTMAFGLAVVGPAYAEQIPTALPADGRIKRFVYNEHTVYRLDTHTNFISTVQFGAGENVESIQVGDSASWQIVRLKRGDVISIKPLNSDAVTNMTVYTDRRVYTFELRAKRGRAGARSHQNYRTTFAYPTPVLFEGTGRAHRNHDYHVAGEAEFAPIEVYDDGRQTYFLFPPDVERPALFSVGRFGKESIVNVRTVGDRMVADGVHDRWTVRLDGEAVCIAQGRYAKRRPRVFAASVSDGP